MRNWKCHFMTKYQLSGCMVCICMIGLLCENIISNDIPCKGKSQSKSLFYSSNIHIIFYMTWCMCSVIDSFLDFLLWRVSLLSRIGFICLFLKVLPRKSPPKSHGVNIGHEKEKILAYFGF